MAYLLSLATGLKFDVFLEFCSLDAKFLIRQNTLFNDSKEISSQERGWIFLRLFCSSFKFVSNQYNNIPNNTF